MKAQSLLESTDTAAQAEIPAKYADPDGYWTGSASPSRDRHQHRRWKKEFGQRWQCRRPGGLLDPKYKDLIVRRAP